jgi:hypothetical protein
MVFGKGKSVPKISSILCAVWPGLKVVVNLPSNQPMLGESTVGE